MLVRQQAGVGDIQLRVRMIGLEGQRFLEGGQGWRTFAAVELGLAHVAQAEEFVAGRGGGRLLIAAGGEEQRDGASERPRFPGQLVHRCYAA